jgi:hypothetical protein
MMRTSKVLKKCSFELIILNKRLVIDIHHFVCTGKPFLPRKTIRMDLNDNATLYGYL